MKKTIYLILLVVLMTGFKTTNRIEALISKQIKENFAVDSYSKEALIAENEITTTFPIQLNGNNFFRVKSNENLLGYYYHGQAFGKADYFDFIVVLDSDLVVTKVKVLIYREDHGGEIASKRWLKQFNGTPMNKKLEYEKDIVGISGATISVRAMTNEVNKVLETFDIMAKNKLI